MKRFKRRDKLKIYGDLLAVLNSENNNEKILLTWVQLQINVPFDRLKMYISELIAIGFIEDRISLKVTLKGKQYLKEHNKFLKIIKRMGLVYK